jgi:hypothetical protein
MEGGSSSVLLHLAIIVPIFVVAVVNVHPVVSVAFGLAVLLYASG